jgi:hypothetical protein
MEQDDDTRNGTSRETAVVVRSIAQEYAWLRNHHPGFQMEMQSLSVVDGRAYDVLRCRNDRGQVQTFYFDVSQFFGN